MRHTKILSKTLLYSLTLLMVLFAVTACGTTDEKTGPEEEPTQESPAGDDVAGTYVGEFGASIELEEGGTLDAIVPLTLEVAEDGSVTGGWQHSTTVPDTVGEGDIDSAETSATLTGTLEDGVLEASGKATLVLIGPLGKFTDTTGVILTGELSGENIVGEISGYGDSESFIVTRQ